MNDKIWGHPKGIFLVSGVELWERFSYYGMLGLLVLFLTASSNSGGFQWSTETALKLMGVYTGLVFAAPAVGGWIANRYWGERKCIFYGGVLVTVGHLLLGGPAYFPLIVDYLYGNSISGILLSSGVSYENFFLSSIELIEILPPLTSAADYSWLLLTYHLKLWSFLTGLTLIVLGTGLIKPAVSSIINHFYSEDSKSRQSGFAIFMASIYLGSFSANFIAGTLGEKVGWHAGFSVAAVGMIVGMLAYLFLQKKYLGDIGTEPLNPSRSDHSAGVILTKEDKSRLALVILMGLFTVIYAVAFYQKGGMLNLYTKSQVDREVLGFEIPTTWFLSISTGIFILFAPFLVKTLTRVLPSLDAIKKLALGLAFIALAYGILAAGDFHNGTNKQVPASWIVLNYILFGLGDILVWPAQIAAAAALSPKHLTSFVIGAWYLTIGIGSWLTGYVGALSIDHSYFEVFTLISVTCFVAAAVLILFYPVLIRLAGGASLR